MLVFAAMMGQSWAWSEEEQGVHQALYRFRDAFNARNPKAFVGETEPKQVVLAPPYNGQIDSTWLLPADRPNMTLEERMPDAVPPVPNLAQLLHDRRFPSPPYVQGRTGVGVALGS